MSKLQEYNDAAGKYLITNTRFENYVNLILQVGESLTDSLTLTGFTHLPSGSGVPLGFNESASRIFNMSEWPSAADLANIIHQLEEQRINLYRAYERLSSADRLTTKSPRDLIDT